MAFAWKPEDAANGQPTMRFSTLISGRAKRSEKKDELLTSPGVMVETATSALNADSWRLGNVARSEYDERRLISGDAKSTVVTWDVATAKEITRRKVSPGTGFKPPLFHPTANSLV